MPPDVVFVAAGPDGHWSAIAMEQQNATISSWIMLE